MLLFLMGESIVNEQFVIGCHSCLATDKHAPALHEKRVFLRILCLVDLGYRYRKRNSAGLTQSPQEQVVSRQKCIPDTGASPGCIAVSIGAHDKTDLVSVSRPGFSTLHTLSQTLESFRQLKVSLLRD